MIRRIDAKIMLELLGKGMIGREIYRIFATSGTDIAVFTVSTPPFAQIAA